MRVLVLHSELGVLRGGGENFTRNLFSAFARRGHDVSAAFAADVHGHYPIPLPDGIHPIPIAAWWSRKLGQSTLASIRGGVALLGVSRGEWDRVQDAVEWRTIRWHNRRFRRRVEKHFAGRWGQWDAIYVHGDAFLASAVARYRPTLLRLPGPVGRDLADELTAVNAVCANGDALTQLRALFGDLVMELPPGVDEYIFSPGPTSVRRSLGWSDRHRVIGYVGRLTHLKGVDVLAEAFHEISRRSPDARLLIVGVGELEQAVRSTLDEEIRGGTAHIEPDVPHERLAEWYRAMDVLVMPSRYENFSNAILEAMACGTTFVASDVGGNRRIAAMAQAKVFEVGSAGSLVSAIDHALANAATTRSTTSLGIEYVRNRYTWGASSDRLESIFREHVR